MTRRSTILKLPADIRAYIARVREDGHTLDEITEALQEEFGLDVSRSALGRYTKQMDRVTKQLQNSRHMAQAIAKHFGDKPASDVARANIELLHSIIMDVMVAGGDDGESAPKFDTGDAMKIAIALEKLTKAHKTDTDRDMQVAKDAERKAKEEAVKAVDEAAKSGGMSAETVALVKKNIMGIR